MKKLLITISIALLAFGLFVYHQYNKAYSNIKPISGYRTSYEPSLLSSRSSYKIKEPISNIISDYKKKGFISNGEIGLYFGIRNWPFHSSYLVVYLEDIDKRYHLYSLMNVTLDLLSSKTVTAPTTTPTNPASSANKWNAS